MKVRLFPDGGVHSMYLEMVNHPPEGIEYVGDFSYSPGTSLDVSNKNMIKGLLDITKMPYVVRLKSDDFIHSCQKLLWTGADFVVDVEHGNPFMGAYEVFKHMSPQFRFIVKRLLGADNCKGILPWSKRAERGFKMNFEFLGGDILNNKVHMVYPAVSMKDRFKKYDKFTFIFIGGESFYAKGGLQVLKAFEDIKHNWGFDCDLIMVGKIPQHIRDKYEDNKDGIWIYSPMDRGLLLHELSKCHCLLLPSVGDTFGMTLLEAKSMGVPAVVVDSFAAMEIVTDWETGRVIRPDGNIDPWFDENGCKRMGKDDFHYQFKSYTPTKEHVENLAEAMMDISKHWSIMGRKCMSEIMSGKFSIEERNKKLGVIYEGA